MINYKFDKYLNLDLRLMQYVPSDIQSLSVGNGLTYDYNMRKSARWNRRLLKRQLLNNNEDMSRREAKNLATQNVGNYINTLGKDATSSDKEWLEDRTSQYHLDNEGKLLRNKSNFWKGLAVAGSALAFTPIAGGAVASAINWNKYDKWLPGKVTLPQELTQENNQTYTPLNQYSMMDRYMKDPSEYIPSYGKSQFSSLNSSVTKPVDNPSSDNPVGNGVVTPKPEFTYAGSEYDLNARNEGFNSRERVAELQRQMQKYYGKKYMETHKDSFDDGLWGDETIKAYKAYKKALEELRSQPLAQGNGNTQSATPFNIDTWNAGVGSSLKWNGRGTLGQLKRQYFNAYKLELAKANQNAANTTSLTDSNFIRNFDNWMNNSGLTAHGYIWEDLDSHKVYRQNLIGGGQFHSKNPSSNDNTTWMHGHNGRKFSQGGQMQSLDLQEEILKNATFGFIAYAAQQLQPMDFNTATAYVTKYLKSKEGLLLLISIAKNKDLVEAGKKIVAEQEPSLFELLNKKGAFMQELAKVEQQQNQLQTVMAKQGTKLSYINSLKGICPEGYEMSYMKAGGKVCPVCKKKVKINKDCGGNMMKMHATGGISEMMNQIKTDLLACGGKMKKVKKDLDGGKAFSDKEMSDYRRRFILADRKSRYDIPDNEAAGKKKFWVKRNGVWKPVKFTDIDDPENSNMFDVHEVKK